MSISSTHFEIPANFVGTKVILRQLTPSSSTIAQDQQGNAHIAFPGIPCTIVQIHRGSITITVENGVSVLWPMSNIACIELDTDVKLAREPLPPSVKDGLLLS